MPTPTSRERVVVDFLVTFMDDESRDRARPLAEYLALYPGFEAEIAREYLALTDPSSAPRPDTSAHAAPDAVGDDRRIGPYRLVEELGRGGQGIVYLAEDTRLKRRVALKILDVRIGASDDMLLRFRREAEVSSRIDHRGICAIYEVGREAGCAYIAMRYVEGKSLSQIIGEREAPPSDRAEIEEIVSLVEKTARALHVAHEAGVVHRDVKPGNIVVDPCGEPTLLDFGFARDDASDAPALTATGAVFGTPAYMSPEQVAGTPRPLDRRTDVYSLGVTLFEALTLRRPFSAPTARRTGDLIRTADLPNASGLNGMITGDLRVILETACERDLDRRYRSAADFADELRRFRRREPILARPAGPLLRLRRWSARNPALAASLAVVVFALAAGLVMALSFYAEERRLNQDVLRLADVRRVRELLRREDEELWPVAPDLAPRCELWLRDAAATLEHRNDHERLLASLRQRAESREPWAFPTQEDAWMHELLVDLLEMLDRLDARAPAVRSRRTAARTHLERSLERYAAEWKACIESIASSPHYGGLRIAPQPGLVPLGASPHSGLWEFWVVESGEMPAWNDDRWPGDRWEDRWDVAEGEWEIAAETGLVLVLLPGGTFDMGARESTGRWTPRPEERGVHSVTLDPFFISKFEMTQAQWVRLFGTNPSFYPPGSDRGAKTRRRTDPAITASNPVESISWHDAAKAARRLGLGLPTEAQWEYACRAGTGEAWFTGDDVADLEGFGNVVDLGCDLWMWHAVHRPVFADDHTRHAPVGSYGPNPFGLYDICGNVFEWCRDGRVDSYAAVAPRPGDGLRTPPSPTPQRALRGGSFLKPHPYSRAATRLWSRAGRGDRDVGVRPTSVLR